MRDRRPAWPLVVLGAWCTAWSTDGPLSSQASADEPSAPVRIARLITRLGNDAYAEREAAAAELVSLGPDARRQLEAATAHDDPEVRLRAKDLLRRLREDDLWQPAKIDFQGRQVAAAEVLAALSRQSGNRLLIGDEYGAFRDRTIDAEYAGSLFWEAVDDLCRRSGNRVRPHYDTRHPGLVVVSGLPGQHPAAYAGPVKMQLNHARRLFSEEFDYEQLRSERSHTFQLDLQAIWEDRFRLVAYRLQPEVVEAQTDAGGRLLGQATAGGWNIAGSGTKQVTMNIRLQPPPTSARSLKMLRLRWGLVAMGDLAQLDVDDLQSSAPHFQDDLELTIESFQTAPGGRCELTLLLVREAVLLEPAELVFQENEIELFDAQGRAYRKHGQTNTLSDRGPLMKLSFSSENSDSVPRTLRVTYPRIRSQRDLEIVFRDVPLPVGRPE